MKNTFAKQKFKGLNFVKPLYRNISKVKPNIQSYSGAVDNAKLCSHGFYVKRKTFHDKSVDFDLTSIQCDVRRNSGYRFLPGTCEIKTDAKSKIMDDEVFSITNGRLRNTISNETENSNEHQDNKRDKSVQAYNKIVIPQKIPACWLHVYPDKEVPGDSVYTILFRFLVCQFGLACFLVIWTLLWVFIINYYEEPHEWKVSREFENRQNQLVIELATELRQMTPVSPRWRDTIERRIEEERKLTMQAVARGAILQPGNYWKLAGTFLFGIYVMTALGFGAPVPQTILGRSSALIYAVLAVPIHIYFMVNLSTCIVTKVDHCIRKQRKVKINRIQEKSTAKNKTNSRINFLEQGNPTCSRNSDKGKNTFRAKILRFCRFLLIGRCVPLAAVLYYILGAVAFGVIRGKKGLDVVMFPAEFTTSGGLELVEEYVRFFYGFYVEGAMTLLACILASIRIYSSEAAYSVAQHYNLFEYQTTD